MEVFSSRAQKQQRRRKRSRDSRRELASTPERQRRSSVLPSSTGPATIVPSPATTTAGHHHNTISQKTTNSQQQKNHPGQQQQQQSEGSLSKKARRGDQSGNSHDKNSSPKKVVSKTSVVTRNFHHHDHHHPQHNDKTEPPPPAATDKKQDQQAQNQQQQQQLPVQAYRQEILDAVLRKNVQADQVVIITAETGSGKSTLIPTFFLSSSSRDFEKRNHHHHHRPLKIVVTQPRRVAAITLATRVAAGLLKQNGDDGKVGRTVGYKVRFDDCTNGSTTRLVYATDGMLLREAMADPLLLQYDLIFLDEAHERSLQTDLLMGIVQRARAARCRQKRRTTTTDDDAAASSSGGTDNDPLLPPRPLHVIVMSATLSTSTFVDFFGGPDHTTILSIPGRQHPVQVLYATAKKQQQADDKDENDDYREAALSTILQIHRHEPAPTEQGKSGDILVFLPGQEEIEDLAAILRQCLTEAAAAAGHHDNNDNNKALRERFTGDHVQVLDRRFSSSSSSGDVIHGVLVCVMYAALPPEAQLAVFGSKPVGCRRRVILATNIAETSVTLPDVTYVVDCGRYKSRQSVAATGLERLIVEKTSRAQATQRTGRAGRVHPGLCFRLYSEDDYEARPATNPPEILRINLAHVVLQLKGMGIADPATFEFVTPPDPASLRRATKQLYALGALDEAMDLTEHGRKLAKLPLDPVFGHMLLQGERYSCVKELLTAVALLSSDNLFYRPSGIGPSAARAAAAHKRFKSHEGDIPTFLKVYDCWQREAVYVPPASGGRQAQKRQQTALRNDNNNNILLLHEEWCRQNFISSRSLARAYDVRKQLEGICKNPPERNGMGMDVTLTADGDEEGLLKCIAAGLFLQAASRSKVEKDSRSSRGAGDVTSTRGRYRTMVGKIEVNIHPTSTMFARQPAPACVVYTELVATKRSYIRTVTQIREEWLPEVAPAFYKR